MKKILLLLIFLTSLISSGSATCPANGGTINNAGQSFTLEIVDSCSPITTTFTVNGGTLTVNGSLTVTGTITLSGSGTIIVNGSLTISGGSGGITGNGTFIVNGSVNVVNGANLSLGGSGSAGGSGIIISDATSTVDTDITDNVGNGTCYNNGTDECCGSQAECAVVLPIVLGSFNVEPQESSISLSWQTITEENFDFFSIERSEDGKDFYEIGTIPGHGNSNDPIDYSFEDEDPLFGMSYYRLNAIDYDGSYEKFQILSVEFVPEDLKISLYPNPSSGNNLRVRLGLSKQASTQQLAIYNLSGERLFQSKLSLGRNDFNFQNLLESGLYFAKVQVDNFISTRKLIIN